MLTTRIAATEYQRHWESLEPRVGAAGVLEAIVVRLGGEQHATTHSGTLDVQFGLLGDRWYRGPRRRDRQVSVISRRTLETLTSDPAHWTEAGDNLIVTLDLSERTLTSGSSIRIGEAVLRVTDTPHLACARFAQRFGEGARAWVNEAATRPLRLRGIYCEVLRGGVIRCQDLVEKVV